MRPFSHSHLLPPSYPYYLSLHITKRKGVLFGIKLGRYLARDLVTCDANVPAALTWSVPSQWSSAKPHRHRCPMPSKHQSFEGGLVNQSERCSSPRAIQVYHHLESSLAETLVIL